MTIYEILNTEGREQSQIIEDLKHKTVVVPSWGELINEYDPKKHPVFTDRDYTRRGRKGKPASVTQIGLGWQKLAVKRMGELAFGIPVKRIYSTETDEEKRAAAIMEAIYQKNRVDSLNISRSRQLYASCEIATIWFVQPDTPTQYAGEKVQGKIRCKTFSPMNGDKLYPLFDEYDDMVALSVEYARKENDENVTYFETYTADRHLRWRESTLELDEPISTGKISGVYFMRPEPIWEDQSNIVYEAEWTISRNGNYIRKNARPNVAIYSNKQVAMGKDNDNKGLSVYRLPKDAKMEYVVWQQATDSIKFQVDTIKQLFFMQLQLPDMSMESMKATPMSGEARKMMFIDSQLKVTDEQGMWLEGFDREFNVIRALCKFLFPSLSSAFDAITCEHVITPFNLNEIGDKIKNLTTATGGKAVMSQRTAIKELDMVDDIDEELKAIAEEETNDIMGQMGEQFA